MRIFSVPYSQVDLIWEEIATLLQTALDYSQGWITREAVRAKLGDRRAQLFVGTPDDGNEIVGVMVTEIQVNHEGRKGLNIVALSAKAFEPFAEQGHAMLEDWAREIGADQLVMMGRPGWKGPLKKHGWTVSSIQMRKEFNYGRT